GVERAAAPPQQGFHVVRLLKLIQYRCPRILSHARRAEFVDRPSFGQYAVAYENNLETGRLEHFLRCLFHVLHHVVFVLAELVVKAQRRDAPLVLHHRIEIDKILVTREHFSKRAHADVGTLILPDFFLERGAKTGAVRAWRKHAASAAALEAVASDKFWMFLREVAKPGG